MTALLQNMDDRGVLLLTLDRPAVHNAFDPGLIRELTHALREADKDPRVRAVVLTGAGTCFSAGADIAWMRGMVHASEDENLHDALQLAALMRTLNYLSLPTIAMVNGHAFGGGVGLVACCDMTIAADHATFGLTETTLGLAPAVISPYVFRRIGEGNARRYFLSGERFDAIRARDLGLLQDLVPAAGLEAATEEIVAQVLCAGPEAVKAAKKLAFTVAGHDEAAQLRQDEHTARLIARLRVSTEGQEGLAAFLEKRAPAWMGQRGG